MTTVRRVCFFARWVYRPVHGCPVTGRVWRLKPRAAWELACSIYPLSVVQKVEKEVWRG